MNRLIHRWIGVPLLLVLVSLSAPALAGELKSIEVRGNKRVEADAVKMVIRSKPGTQLSAEQVATDLKSIYSLGYFADVRAEVETRPEGEVLIFVVMEKPSIAEIKYRGNEEVDLEKIKEVVDIQPLSVLDITKIKANEQKIKDLYVDKGFFLAEVSHELKPQPNNRVELTFVITERAKVMVKRITFIGNEHAKKKELEDNMETKEGGLFSWLTSTGTFKDDALKRDVLRLTDYYYNHGFINVKVSEPIVEISRDRASLFITIAIEEGLQFRFGNLDFAGDLLVPDGKLLEKIEGAQGNKGANLSFSEALSAKLGSKSESDLTALKLALLAELKQEVESRMKRGVWAEDEPPAVVKDELREQARGELSAQLKRAVLKDLLLVNKGEIFNRQNLVMSMFKIQDVYKDRGYAYVEATPDTDVDSKNRIAHITFNIQKGQKVFIDKIVVKGNLKTRDKVVRRQMRVYEGELYSGTGMEISKRRVNALGFFETVNITEKRGSAEDRIVITVEVKERPTGTFQIGAGFSSVENFIATAQISQQNLFGRGQTLSLMAQLSKLRQYFSLNFVDEYFLDSNWYFGFTLYNTQLDYINFLREATGGDLTLGYEFYDNWRFSVTYTLEDVNVSTNGPALGGIRDSNLYRDGWTSSVRLSLSWDTRDNRLFPSSGHLLQGSVEHASEFTFSENKFTRYTGVARKYFPVIWGLVLKTNLTLGYLTPGAPIFEKYFVGGIYTIRGFEPRSIGPQRTLASNGWDPSSALDPTNVGGNKQILGNIELEFPIFPQVNIRGVLFLDAGNAYDEGEQFLSERYGLWAEGEKKETVLGVYWSTGFGFRWFSPIGPLRFEWGIPLTRRPTDKDILFEFTIGNFF